MYALLKGGKWRLNKAHARSRMRQAANPRYVKRYAKVMLKRSARLAGPYRRSLTATSTTSGGNTTLRFTLRSASKHAIANTPVTFRYGGRTVRTQTSAAGVATASLPAGAPGSARASASATRVSLWGLRVRSPRGKGPRLAIAGRHATVTAATTVRVAGVQRISISNSSAYKITSAVGGRYSVDGWGGSRSAKLTLYGPFTYASSASCSSNALRSWSTTVDADTTRSLSTRVSNVGFYRWGISVAGNSANQAASACGRAFVVKAVPSIRADHHHTPVDAGSHQPAVVTVSHLGKLSSTLSVSVHLYGPFKKKSGPVCNTKHLLKTVRTTTGSNSKFWSPKVTVKKAGWYVWTASLGAGDYSLAAASKCRATGSYLQVKK